MAYLRRRRQGFEFQIRVPKPLRARYGKETISEGLNTRDADVAQARANERAAYYQTLFAAQRGNGAAQADLRRRLYLGKLAEARRERPDLYRAGDDDGVSMGMDLLLEDARKRGVPLDDGGNPETLPPDLQAQFDALVDFKVEVAGGVPPRRKEYGLTVSEAAKEYLAKRLDRITNQTREQHETVYRLFASFVADKAMSAITRADAVGFLDAMREFEPNWGRSPETKTRTFEELRVRFAGKGQQLSARTLSRYATSLGKLWEWAETRQEVDGKNPFHKIIDAKRARGQSSTYLPMSDDELKALFNPLPGRSWLWEVAAVALFSGMRANEICSLTWENIRQRESVWYFDIVAAKSAAGVRPVPVHSRLMWLLERRSEPGSLVWPSLKQGGADGKFSVYYSKQFTEWRRARGVTAEGKVFHSLRKNVVRCFERARVPQNEVAEIVGHEKLGITFRVYNPDGLTMTQRKELVELIAYPGVDLPW